MAAAGRRRPRAGHVVVEEAEAVPALAGVFGTVAHERAELLESGMMFSFDVDPAQA
jgi:hypothetical protein